VTRLLRGLSILALLPLAACMGPMTQREAQTIAGQKLARYCHGACGRLTLAHTQKIKDRWLIDYDAPAHRFTVIVEDDGNSAVNVWTKDRAANGQ
jgi:hypothetical protein